MDEVDPRVGAVLHGRYQVLERLTAGSMGVVYRAERVQLKKPVAVKVLHESYAATADGMRRFEVEARAMSRLGHPNCVAVIDFGVDNGAPYLVMDFITGCTLREIIQQEGRLAPRRAIDIVRQILAGLAHAHGHGIVHRDMKPENILVTAVEGHGEQVRIVDFGLAKLRDEKTVTTGVALGTPGYMSPEQTAGSPVDPRADVYAVGIILYELLVGRKPFQAESPFEVMRMHREVPPMPLSQAAPDSTFSRQLDQLVQTALAKRPADRYADMTAMANALEATPEAGGRVPRHSGRSWRAGLAAVLIAGVAGFGLWATRADSPAAAGGAAAPAAPQGRPASTSGGASPTPPAGAAATASSARVPPADQIAAGSAAAAGASGAAPIEGDDVAALRARAAAGEHELALRELDAIRLREPRRADVYYALGVLYTEAQSWQAAASAYSTALTLEPAYRSDPRLIGDVVEALADNSAHKRAAIVISTQLGAAALPRLAEAARSANPRLRSRAEHLQNQLQAVSQ
jgi:eukaryotic-like serine/threonine-protein kinase